MRKRYFWLMVGSLVAILTVLWVNTISASTISDPDSILVGNAPSPTIDPTSARRSAVITAQVTDTMSIYLPLITKGSRPTLLGCVDFEDLPWGTVFTVPASFSDSGATVSVQPFMWATGTWTNEGFARIGNEGRAGGTLQEVEVNNVNLDFDFGGPLDVLSLRFGEYGGNLNLTVNGVFTNFNNFADLPGTLPPPLNAAVVNGLGNDTGILELSVSGGTITSFTIGGQELWLDDLCPYSLIDQGNVPAACEDGAFSTEEDFMMTEGEPFDGNPYVSDGDLLSFTGEVCARNADLLDIFYPNDDPPADLGLDAVDILNITNRLVAFSTELDDPNGTFTAGDLLLTNGAIIPNAAFVNPFDIKNDVGFDAVHFKGDSAQIEAFADYAFDLGPDGWGEGQLQQALNLFGIDIWFSIEGTHVIGDGSYVLDGDLLSATGVIVLDNAALLPPLVPAGIPIQGVDFGLDAVTGPQVHDQPGIRFSTELLYQGETNFTDGDVLLQGNGVDIADSTLYNPFVPAADFLGTDALYMP